MIDLSKIRVGDEVTVRCIVKEVVGSDRDLVVVKPSSNPGKYFADMWISKDWIATHTPKPRNFKPGDRVYEIGFDSGFIVVHVYAEMAWISDGVNWNKIARLLHLRHADENE